MRRVFWPLIGVALLTASCSGGSSGGASGNRGASSGGQLIVSAASSLTEAFTQIGRDFEQQNPGTSVRFNFGPSDGLAAQIDQGAPVNVFASASPTWMDAVQRDGPGVSDRADFARNKLAIIVPKDDPAGIRSLDDLTKSGVKLVLAAKGVPAGDYAREIFDNAAITDAAMANVVSNEEDDKAVVQKVLSGDADAGIVYVTDATPDIADQVTLVPIPPAQNVIATYPIAVVAGSKEADLANAFVQYVLGPGQRTLGDFGFLPAS